ncbi:MAG TPA: dipeptide/oligopeptide/nickel ABC transporter ATP-binding protein [Elusimicrobia bacterium]|nr:MAG: hypothetical protein A2278_07625 [Elusimicrobia bacterium RIFOXYA12_FULL_49_49]OGS10049.1 MAG: hypothetical protein A2204_08120 [Elusimicrobia bacterium RIFOXYA1_FULL_47_7]OGS10588.1 MAG: hypothetical protein A2386_00115 [Elusimicrobia bacterium RIFOXYB1_FULL_48_9]OGS16065.1 MAG: hypothetical protein A2251_02640 [Elusimicrobia bacterium RIFOXYA2_FULL_47_53]OGS26691.1 MAG: hypothetical protein A2339_03690 [Elusimicrobia bacterium RIFOXYB12_FULL_50_12]OGS30183.1 MAG: hypothetical protein
MIKINGVSKSFFLEEGIFGAEKKRLLALDTVSLDISRGEAVGIVGESGSGKTTLGRVACGLLKPDSGSVFVDSKPLGAYTRAELGSKIQMVFQDPFASLNPKLSVASILGEAAVFIKPERRRARVLETLEIMGLSEDFLASYPHQFSGGQRQRIAIARCLLREPELIIADEPLSSLDISTQCQLLDTLKELKESRNVAFIFITHDFAAAAAISDRIAVMKNGRIVEEGSAERVINAPSEPYTKNLISAVPEL